MSITTNLSLDLPTVGPLGTTGPDWANKINTAFGVIDAHDHTDGKGARIPTSALNINANLEFNTYAATELQKAAFDNQGSALSGATHANSVSVSGGNLYFTNNSGTAVQITSGSGLNLTALGTIGGDYSTSTASLNYFVATKLFAFKQDSTKTADIAAGSYFLYENITSANYIKLKSPASLAASYDVTLFTALPASTLPVLFSSSGALSTGKIADNQFRQSVALSVVGRSGNSTGDTADIVGTDGQVLRVSGTTLGFGTIVAAGLASDSVITAKILDANVTTAKLDAATKLLLAKAWVNFNAVPASGTYSRSGTTITVTLTSHGMTTGMLANLDFTTGTASDGTYAITNTGANTFTVVDAVSGSTSGNVTRNLYIRSSYNVSSTLGITDNGVGDWTVNFANALTDVNYAAIPSVGGTAGGSIIETADDSTARTTTAIRLVASTRSGGAAVDEAQIGLIVMGN